VTELVLEAIIIIAIAITLIVNQDALPCGIPIKSWLGVHMGIYIADFIVE